MFLVSPVGCSFGVRFLTCEMYSSLRSTSAPSAAQSQKVIKKCWALGFISLCIVSGGCETCTFRRGLKQHETASGSWFESCRHSKCPCAMSWNIAGICWDVSMMVGMWAKRNLDFCMVENASKKSWFAHWHAFLILFVHVKVNITIFTLAKLSLG